MENIIKIYAAGKIDKNGWRLEIGIGRRTPGYEDLCKVGFEVNCETPSPRAIKQLQRLEYEIQPGIIYVGPYAIACDHGCYHGIHGVSADPIKEYGANNVIKNEPTAQCLLFNNSDYAKTIALKKCQPIEARRDIRNAIHKNSLAQIESCTHLFAWIDDITAYGTFNEIGYATGLKKKIYIGIDETKVEVLDQLWFTFESAQNIFVTACAGDAWHRMLNCIKSETKLTLPLNIR